MMTHRFLFITHQLSRTGAPLMLLELARTLISAGNDIRLISLDEGELRRDYEDLGIEVSLESSFLKNWEVYVDVFSQYDCVFLNTIVTFEAAHILDRLEVPTIWWIHEPEEYFQKMKEVLPDLSRLKGSVHPFAVSPSVRSVVEDFYGIKIPIFTLWTADKRTVINAVEASFKDEVRFLCVGLYSYTKGQDVLTEAIRSLPPEILEKSRFIFCGDEAGSDPKYVETVRGLTADFPVEMVGSLPHDALLQLMAEADYLVVPSRMEAMPTVAVEAMMLSKPLLLSEGCGVIGFMTGQEGEFFPPEDPKALADTLCRAVDGSGQERYRQQREAARRCYEAHFSEVSFRDRLGKILRDVLPPRRLITLMGNYDIIDIFTIELADAFEEMGYEVLRFDCSRLEESLPRFTEFVSKGRVSAALTFNFYGTFMELKEGRNLWESLQIPVITYLMDHPFCFCDAFERLGTNDIILSPDKNHMNYVTRFYPNIPTAGFWGHGGIERAKAKKPIRDRKIQVLYAGGISRPNIEKVMPDFSRFDFDAKAIGDEAYAYLVAHPEHTTEEVLECILRSHGIDLPDEELRRVIADLHYVDLLAVSYFREKTIRTLVEAGIPVTLYGFGWETLDWVKESWMDFRGRVSAFDIIDLMADTKIVLSTMTWFKDGTHDRVFNGMLAGAAAVTDISKYMEEEFTGYFGGEDPSDMHGAEVGFFRLEEIEKLPDMIRRMLSDEDALQAMADRGYEKAHRSHTWDARAKELDRDLLKYL